MGQIIWNLLKVLLQLIIFYLYFFVIKPVFFSYQFNLILCAPALIIDFQNYTDIEQSQHEMRHGTFHTVVQI